MSKSDITVVENITQKYNWLWWNMCVKPIYKTEAEGYCKFKASLLYTVTSRIARVAQCKTLSQKKTNIKKVKEKEGKKQGYK